eukprot:gene2163-4209_t
MPISSAIINKIQEALKVANSAVNFDRRQNYPNAARDYQISITLIDNILPLISDHNEAFTKLYEHRVRYSMRLDKIRSHIPNEKENLSDKGNSNSAKESSKNSNLRLNFHDEIQQPIETLSNTKSFEKCPPSLPRQPYWQMRLIRNTITNGGYITPNIFVPRTVWFQSNAKYTGVSFKLAAFEQIYIVLTTNIVSLEYMRDIDGLKHILQIFIELSDTLLSIQNTLSKPFPFIHEVEEPIDDTAAAIEASQVVKITSMVSAMAKNARKYAETGYQRIGTAVPTTLNDDELVRYTSLASEICNHCQLLDDWFQFVEQERTLLSEKITSASEMTAEDKTRSELLASLMTEQHNISTFMREVVCELLLRDVEQLLIQYLKRMKDTFNVLPWEQESVSQGGNATEKDIQTPEMLST